MSVMSSRRDWLQIAGIVVVTVAVALVAGRKAPFVGIAENWASDIRISEFTPPSPLDDDIVVLTVTEDTLATLAYRSPLDRGFLARLLRSLEAKGVRAIGIDVLFDQATEEAKDADLRAILGSLKMPVVVAFAGDGLTKSQAAFQDAYLKGIDKGLANLLKDPRDGTVRWIFPGRMVDGERFLGLAGALAAKLGIAVPERTIPIIYRIGGEQDLIPFKTFPAHIAPMLPASWLAGKIVLVGADLDLTDRHRTPFTTTRGLIKGRFPGVVLHAMALAQLIEGSEPPDFGIWAETGLLLAMTVLGIFMASIDIPLPARGLANILAMAVLWAGGVALFRYSGVMIPLVAPSGAFVLAFGVGMSFFRRQERRQKKFLRRAFARYAPPQVVEQLVADPDSLKLSGEKRELTFLFTDLADFTTFCEKVDPEVCVPVLNAYLDGLCRILMDHGGTLDKISGDAVNGIFGAPVEQPDHAARAIACAIDMDGFGLRFAAEQGRGGIDFGITRIGVHTGVATVGNFGGDTRFHYTAHGDAINTAARLESVNKYLGTRVCISGATTAGCPDIRFRPSGDLILKGKSVPTAAFQPLSEAEAEAPEIAAYLAAYRLLAEERPEAREAFAAVLESNPEDSLARLHLKRLEAGETGTVIRLKEK